MSLEEPFLDHLIRVAIEEGRIRREGGEILFDGAPLHKWYPAVEVVLRYVEAEEAP